jgi:hypothetical protein
MSFRTSVCGVSRGSLSFAGESACCFIGTFICITSVMRLSAGIQEQVLGFMVLRVARISCIGEKRSQEARLTGFAGECRASRGD